MRAKSINSAGVDSCKLKAAADRFRGGLFLRFGLGAQPGRKTRSEQQTSTVHPGQGIAAVNDLRLQSGQLFQPLPDIGIVAKVLCHANVSRMVARL